MVGAASPLGSGPVRCDDGAVRDTPDPAPAAELLSRLETRLGPRGLVVDRERLSTYESDGLALYKQRPPLVVLPRDTREASDALALLHSFGVPVVARGAGTGLTGGSTPVPGGAVLSTARMRDVITLEPEGRWARVQAGVVNSDLSKVAAKHGLFYAPDPSSQQACTLGGNVGNNSGGPHCFRHGSTSRHVLGLVAVLADGEVLDLTGGPAGPLLDPAGFDLVGALVGSEGTLALVTEVVVRLLPVPERIETLLAVFSHLEDACRAVSALIAERLEPSAIEILDRLTIEAVEASVYRAGYPTDADAVLLLDVEGTAAEVSQTAEALEALILAHGGRELRRAAGAEERRQLWAGRKGAFGAMGRVAPDLYVTDAVVPRTRLAELVAGTTEICRELGLKLANVFHAGDGNLHPNICYDARDADEVARVLEAGERIQALCIAAGGSLSGEHGIGYEKRDGLCELFAQADLDAMGTLRDAFDPGRRLNPGKLLPTRACLELHTPPLPAQLPTPRSEEETAP